MVGVFAADILGGVKTDLNIGRQVGMQLAAAAITVVYSIIATFILLKITQMIVGLRVKGQDEQQGLDLTQHEERGYSY